MRPAELRTLLARVRRGAITPRDAARAIEAAPMERLAFATLDHQRALRTGFPEVIFGQGKSPEQIVGIAERLFVRHHVVLATRVDAAGRAALAAAFPHAEVHDRARVVILRPRRTGRGTPRRAARSGASGVLVICAGTADLPVAEEALLTAQVMGSRAELISDVGVAGLHRLLAHIDDITSADAVVVLAGMEGALASVVGGLTGAPVVAVPTSVGYGAAFEGLAALLGMINSCAAGVSVVNIDNGFGAGYISALINGGKNGAAGRRPKRR